jgi:uncharacterized protein (UPF0332 family)
VNGSANSRLALARALREQADGSTEAGLRSALSRSYYSVYHAAKALLDKVDHHNLAEELEKIEPGLGLRVERLQELRASADYDPEFIARKFDGDFEVFRLEARRQVNEGSLVFNRIAREIEERSRNKAG